MIEVQGVTFSYPGTTVPALENISLIIKPGEFLAITGPNGSGKSTLARLLNGLLRPGEGRVLVDGLDTGDEASLVDIRRRVGMVFQDPDNQLVAATVEDDVAFGLENLGLPPAEIRQRVAAALEVVELANLRTRPPHRLSGGQKQRLALAGVLAMEPRYLVLDEATAMLDPVAREEILQKVLELRREKGLAVILITHLMEEAALAERVLVLKAGQILLAGPPAEVMQQEEKLAAAGLKVPVTVALGKGLRQAGLKLPANLVTVEEMARALWKLASRK
ncbi:energy-coupling factor transporter ATPase [Neomoorella mulderi]|uniref:Energy-coupling factor transporter ATP-binding protein EcfA1 n=1 Tax=Moorella mulderi DSM 14980 TaxID=1122241 RepID=A0A151B170_9FIRM|nr:energy-coupling factor transporter ATPase [Moorella mulderi]KYH33661.1 energy-coupling factor transporter ATP-binding protein EcfA1 [Moorella mulderi DSM 14980]